MLRTGLGLSKVCCASMRAMLGGPRAHMKAWHSDVCL